MKIYAEGKINHGLAALGIRLSPVYLFKESKEAAIFDAGLTVTGPAYYSSAKENLDAHKPLNYLFITHSHWDHCGSLPYLKKLIPGLKICGHPAIPELFKKETVIKQIRLFNDMMKDSQKTAGAEDMFFEGVAFDLTLKDGDSVDLGDAHCIAYETPGHTKDSLSYYIPEQGILFPGEAIGVPEGKNGDGVQVEFLNSYDDYLASIQRLAELRPKVICMAHEWVFTDDDVAEYFEKSYNETIRYRAMIERYLDEADGNIDAAVELMAKKEYDEKGTFYQPRFAYIANLKVQIKHIATIFN